LAAPATPLLKAYPPSFKPAIVESIIVSITSLPILYASLEVSVKLMLSKKDFVYSSRLFKS